MPEARNLRDAELEGMEPVNLPDKRQSKGEDRSKGSNLDANLWKA
jgi:hypothetical protein